MKKKNCDFTSLALWILIAIMLVLIVLIVVLNIQMQSATEMKSLVFDLLNSLLSAVTVGLIATTFTKIIADNMAKVKRNNEQLKKFGVDFIGTGRSTKKDTLHLFGNPYTKRYPKEVKLLFISGNGYFKTFQRQLFQCVQNSDCVVKILLLSTAEDNLEYIKRMEFLCPQRTPYCDQVNKESLPILKSVVDKLDGNKKSQIQVRFYKDEYRYNFRIAKYCYGDRIQGKCWLNVQPFCKDAVDLSVGLNGSWNNESSSDGNIFELLDSGFDQVWNKYKETQWNYEV